MWVVYLNSVVLGTARPEDLPRERLQELRTLAEALQHAGAGRPKHVCDVLTQRFLALEARATGRPEIARGLELVDTGHHGLATPGQLRLANKALLQQARLDQAGGRLRRNR